MLGAPGLEPGIVADVEVQRIVANNDANLLLALSETGDEANVTANVIDTPELSSTNPLFFMFEIPLVFFFSL